MTKARFWSGPGGALMCEGPIFNVTQDMIKTPDAIKYYGGRYMVGETITRSAAKVIVEALCGEYLEEAPK